MPEYLAPGVFVEETSFRAKSIEGVGTSVAAIVGPTRTGPLRGTPEVLTSFADFERTYGDSEDLVLDGKSYLNYTALAARAFFDNGGKQLFVARIAQDVNKAKADGSGSSAKLAASSTAVTDVAFTSRFPGAVGAYTLELFWTETENLLRSAEVNAAEEGDLLFLSVRNVPASAKVSPGPADGKFPMHVKAVVKRVGAQYVVQGTPVMTDPATDNPVTGTPLSALTVAELAGLTQTLTRVHARSPSAGTLAEGTAATLALAGAVDASAYDAKLKWDAAVRLRGTLDAKGEKFTVAAALNEGVSADFDVPLAALAEHAAGVGSLKARYFTVDVHKDGKDGEVVYRYGSVSTAPGAENGPDKVLAAKPDKRADALVQPVACKLAAGVTGARVWAALEALYDAAALAPPAGSLDGPRRIIALAGSAGDGKVPGAADYAGEVDDQLGNTGLAALENVEDVSIVMTPAAAAHSDSHQAVVLEMQKHLRKMRYRVGIVDSRADMTIGEIRDFRSNFDDSRLALYYPWIVTADPTGRRQTIAVPPAGAVAGVYANTDVTRGVHKPPANEPVLGALRFNQEINRFQQELLNPSGINCLRSFPGRGHRVWGGRTLASDPEWKYVNVRRYFLYLERSIDKSTQWAVFEPNGEALWANIRTTVEDFLYNEWCNGRLLGGTPKAAYFVRCDRSTMTQNDIDNGRLVCEVGVAALKPAEFVIFRIGQKTADA